MEDKLRGFGATECAVRPFLWSLPEGMPRGAEPRWAPASKTAAVPPGAIFSSASTDADCESCALTTPFETRPPQVWIQDFSMNRTWARLVVRSELLKAGHVVRLSGLGLAPVDERDACAPSTLAPACLSNASLWAHEGPRWRSQQLRCPYAEHVWEGAVPAEEFQCRFDAAGALTCQASLQVCVGPFRGGGGRGRGCPVRGQRGCGGGRGCALWGARECETGMWSRSCQCPHPSRRHAPPPPPQTRSLPHVGPVGSDVLERPYAAGGGRGTPPHPRPPLPMFEADCENFASAPSVPRGFNIENVRPAFGGDHRGTLGGWGGPANPPSPPHSKGAYRALCTRCAKSWLFSTTGSSVSSED